MTPAIELVYLFPLLLNSMASKAMEEPVPADWPHQFHALMFMNRSGNLQKLDLWYDWPNDRNFNIIQNQLDDVVKYDLEWNNGTSYIYTLHPSNHECQVMHFEVGILRPIGLKVDFIWYYEDVPTRRPVKWIFYSGYTAHVMIFEVGAALEDPNWHALEYCFSEAEKEKNNPILRPAARGGSLGGLMRGIPVLDTM